MSSTRTSYLADDDDSSDDRQTNAVSQFWSILFTLSLVFAACCMIFFFIRYKRRVRNIQKSYLPIHHPMTQQSTIKVNGQPHPLFVVDERRNLIANSSSPAGSPVPEIHITLPDEDEASGQAKPGRVVVVHITDSGSVGMTPLSTEPLPKYEKEDSGRFKSVDLESIGGLRESPRATSSTQTSS